MDGASRSSDEARSLNDPGTAPVRCWIDGRRDDRPVDAATAATGGHFTSLQLRGGAAQGLDLHLARLRRDHLATFAMPLTDARLAVALAPVVHDPAAVDATLHVAVTGPAAGAIPCIRVSLQSPRHVPATPVRVLSAVHERRQPLRKHDDIAGQRALQARAAAAGFDDALLLGAGDAVLEGTFWNVVVCRGGQLLWPTGPSLPGVTRDLLRSALAASGLVQHDAPLALASLTAADAVFAMNARGVWSVACIDDLRFRLDGHGLARLRQLLAAQPWQGLGALVAGLAVDGGAGGDGSR